LTNLLIGIPSPRDIPEFLEATAKLPYDRYWAKYYTEYPAFSKITDFFLEHKEYSHLAILCDDLIVKPIHAEQLFTLAVDYGYPAIGGVCNVGREAEWDECYNISLSHLTNPQRVYRRYEFIKIAEAEEQIKKCPIVQTRFQGFPFTIIRRDIVERFPFKTDGFYNEKPGRGCCTDTVFCWETAHAGVPMWADLRVVMYHLPNSRYLTNAVGQKEAHCYLEKAIVP
jgi:hypothetical protein